MATFDSKTIVMMAENGHSVEIDGKKIQLTIVQEAVEAKPEYSHLVGKWYKVLESSRITKVFHGKHMKCFGIDKNDGTPLMGNDSFGKDYHGLSNPVINTDGWKDPEEVFDLSNPLDHNPDEVRVFDVPSEIRIFRDWSGLNLCFSGHHDNRKKQPKALRYNKDLHRYSVMVSSKSLFTIPCIATKCKFEDLCEGDLFFATDNDKPDFTWLSRYSFLSNNKRLIWTDGNDVHTVAANPYKHYFKITPKP